MLKSLDLFSGCGGITHALRGIAHPVMYCEWEPSCQDTLKTLMKSGKLPKAPIHIDVQTLNGKPLKGKVELIAGGWPCVGFSNAGKRQGFENQQSGLFAHVVRLVKEIQPQCVFMENVVPVTHGTGIQNVCSSLGKLGYVLWWLTAPAYVASGECPHVRQRWFCLGVRKDSLRKLKVTVKTVDPHSWKKEPVPRMIPTGNPTNTKRLGMLGNSVVPDAVRAAFLMLWTGTTNPKIAFKAGTYVVTPPVPGAVVPTGSPCPYGMYDGSRMVAIPPPIIPKKPALTLVLDPAGVPQPDKLNPAITTDIVTAPVNFTVWSTPRHGNTGPCRVLTMRSKGDLPTQLRYEKKTPKKLRLGHPSADWVDWLMGYEPGWTAF
jgi:hypothetical protein